MAREYQFGPYTTGVTTLRGYLKRSTDGYMYDVAGSQWEIPGTSAVGDYDIPLTEDGSTGHYTADAVGGVAIDGVVSLLVFDQATPAWGDTGYVGEARAQRVDVRTWLGATAPANTGDAYARLGAPAGASTAADIAAVKSDTAGILADTGTDGVVLSSAVLASIADTVLRRQTANVEASSSGDTLDEKSLIGAVAKLVHLIEVAGGVLTVKKSDGTTTFYTQAVTSDATAEPITGLGAAS